MYGERRPEFDPDQFMRNVRESWDNFRSRLPGGGNTGALILGALIVIILIWGATGIYVVQPGQQATVRLFGEFRGIEDPGLKWYFPTPIGTVRTEDVEEIRSIEVGFRLEPQRRVVENEALMITGDLANINIEMVVQYRVANVEQFHFNVSDPGDPDRNVPAGRPDGQTLREATEAALRQVVGQRSVDATLTQERAAVETDTRELLQTLLDEYEAGIAITGVVLQDVRPPNEVRAAFDDVVSARLDFEARVNEARAYEQDQLPRAQGAAQQTVQAAQAFREARIAEARGESAEFTSIWEAYETSPDVTRQRLYLETMERILPRVTMYILDDGGTGGGNGVLPFLPLAPLGGEE
ncbi:MAG: FtsH protease activity modulator HflK [Dehalococcoidia bacterium]